MSPVIRSRQQEDVIANSISDIGHARRTRKCWINNINVWQDETTSTQQQGTDGLVQFLYTPRWFFRRRSHHLVRRRLLFCLWQKENASYFLRSNKKWRFERRRGWKFYCEWIHSIAGLLCHFRWIRISRETEASFWFLFSATRALCRATRADEQNKSHEPCMLASLGYGGGYGVVLLFLLLKRKSYIMRI